jgi:urease accessory protein
MPAAQIAPAGGEDPARPLPSPGLVGHLQVTAIPDGEGRTRIGRQSFQAPYHIGQGYWDGRVLQLRIINATAGILAGDRLALAAEVTEGAALALISPAATRAFVMDGGAARCDQRFAVRRGAWLEYAAEPLFPHAATDYEQTTHLEADAGAELCFVDTLAPGRTGRGEIWAWRRLRLGLTLSVAGELLLRERLDATGPEFGRLAAFYGMPEAWFGTVILCSPRLSDGDPLWRRLRDLHGPACRVAHTRIRPGVWLVRVIAAGSLELRDRLAQIRTLAATTLPRLSTDLRRI